VHVLQVYPWKTRPKVDYLTYPAPGALVGWLGAGSVDLGVFRYPPNCFVSHPCGTGAVTITCALQKVPCPASGPLVVARSSVIQIK